MLNPSRLIQFSRDYFCVVDPDPDLFGLLDPVKNWIQIR